MESGAIGIEKIDNAVDDWWDRHLRGKPALDRLMYSASEAANHSLLWHASGGGPGSRASRRPGRLERERRPVR